MEPIFTSLITQLKNPWQYICVGVVWSGILYFNIDKQYLVPFIIVAFGLAYLFEKILNKIVIPICLKIKNFCIAMRLLYVLKHCSPEEKEFLYSRVYQNGNELQIDINHDNYFYKQKKDAYEYEFYLYKKDFNTKEKVIKFLRQLENKKIITNFGNQSMVIPVFVWNVLVKNADKIFKNLKGDKEN